MTPRKLSGAFAHCAVLLAAAAFLSAPQTTCTAFQVTNPSWQPSGTRSGCSHNNDAFTRISLKNSGNEDDLSDGGAELAGKFYDQLKKRASAKENQSAGTGISLDDDDETFRKIYDDQVPISNENDSIIDTDEMPQPIQRFTGGASTQRFTGSSSPSVFSEQSSASSNLEREREREFNLAGNFERTFGIQAAILLASLAFVVSVGLSGGITDGSDRYMGGADDIDETAMDGRFQTDDAAEAEAMIRQSTLKSLQTDGDAGEAVIPQSTGESTWL